MRISFLLDSKAKNTSIGQLQISMELIDFSFQSLSLWFYELVLIFMPMRLKCDTTHGFRQLNKICLFKICQLYIIDNVIIVINQTIMFLFLHLLPQYFYPSGHSFCSWCVSASFSTWGTRSSGSSWNWRGCVTTCWRWRTPTPGRR